MTEHEVFVAENVLESRLRHVLPIRHDDHALESLELMGDGLKEGDECEVDEEEPVLCMVDDIDQLGRV
jgi:hypothetical protein